MDVPHVLQALKEATGWTQKQLAQRLGVEQSDVSKWMHGSVPRGPNWEAIRTLAQEYGLVPPEGIRRTDIIQVRGKVTAGGKLDTSEEQVPPEGYYQVEIDDLAPTRPLVAFEIDGPSMLPVYQPGEIVVCYRDQRRDTATYLGKEVVVRTRDGRRWLKRLGRGRRKGLFNLESWNAPTEEDAEIAHVHEIYGTFREGSFRRRG